VETTQQKGERIKNPTCQSLRNRMACHSIRAALLKSVAKIGTRSTMKSRRKALHELLPHTPPNKNSGIEYFEYLFMALWVPISATLFKRAVLVLWHAFLFLGLRFFPLFFFLLGGLHCFSCKIFI
jgi:hypothetical protein